MFKDTFSGIRRNKHRRMKYLVSCICILVFIFSAIALVLSPQSLIPETYAETEENEQLDQQIPTIGDPSELYPDQNIYSLDLTEWGNNPDTGQHSAEFPSQSDDEGKAEPSENSEPILTEHIDVIDESKPLKIWVKLENGQWYSSENISDLSLVDPSDIVFYAIENPYGFIGYYVSESDTNFGHCPIVYSPILDNGTFFREPVGGMYLKLWVKAGGQWYQKYITDRALGYDYRAYMTWEELDSDTWQLGWHIDDMALTVGAATRMFDVSVAIQISQNEKNAKIKQEVTPKNDYEDIGLEWMCLTAPNFINTDYELTKVMVENETWSKELPLSQFADITTEIPDYIQRAYLVSENGVKYHTFDFSDLASYGLDATELFRVEDMLMPNGESQYVMRVGATKGEGILTNESLVIDPSLSISDESGYTQITTSTYSVRISDSGGSHYYITVNSNTYMTSVITDKEKYVFQWATYGTERLGENTFTPTILEDDSSVRVVLKMNWTEPDWGGTGENVDVTRYYYFYNDFFVCHMNFLATNAIQELDELQQTTTQALEADLPKYAYGRNGSHTTGLRSADPTYETSYAALKDRYLMYYDDSGRTEIIVTHLIYDDSGDNGNTAPEGILVDKWHRFDSGSYNLNPDIRSYDLVYATFIATTGGNSDPPTYSIADIWNDYLVAEGAAMQTPTTGTYIGWDNNETVYELACDTNIVEFDLDCATNNDSYYPVFKLTGYTDTAANFKLSLEGVEKTKNIDYIVQVDETNDIAIIWWNSSIIATDDQTFKMESDGGVSTYTLDVHIIEDRTKEDYWYGWVKLYNEHWNQSAYCQLNATGQAQFTNLENGNYYLEIYPPEGSGVFGHRIGVTNVTVLGNTNTAFEVYDYRGHIAMNWGLRSGETNMTQYILERMEGVGAQKGDVIQLYVGYSLPTTTTTNWGKPTFKDVVLALKQAGYMIWIETRTVYVEDYSFWKTLDDFSDAGYGDGDYYNEGTNNDDYIAHNAFMQLEPYLTTIKNTTHTGDTKKIFSVGLDDAISICLRQQDYWDVYDVNDSAYLSYGAGAEEWSFDNATVTLTIHDATQNHVYEIYYLGGYGRLGAPIGSYNPDPYFIRNKLMQIYDYWFDNCTLPDGSNAIDGIHICYGDWRALGSWNIQTQLWTGMVTKVVIDWFLGNYTQYASDFKLSWVTVEGSANEFARGRNDSLPFMHDWLYFREKLLHEEWYKPLIHLAKHYNATVISYDGDESRGNSADWLQRVGCDMFEHQSGAGLDYDTDDFFRNYANYWASKGLFMWDVEETWQDSGDLTSFRANLLRQSVYNCLPSVLYNHQSPYGYDIPVDRYDEYAQAHSDFREIWSSYKQHTEWKVAKIYIMVGVVSRQSSFFYGYADGTWLTPQIPQIKFTYQLPAQIDYISTYFLEENGVPDDCDILIIAGEHEYAYFHYHALYSDTLNTTLTTYVTDGGAIWFMGDVGRTATNGTTLGTGYFEKLAGITCVNFTWSYLPHQDIYYVDETHWIINDEEGHGLIDLCEGYELSAPDIIGEPQYVGITSTNMAATRFNISASAKINDVVIWFGNSTHKLPYLYIRDDIGSGYVAFTPVEKLPNPMAGRLYETFRRTFFYLSNTTAQTRHVNITLENFWTSRGCHEMYLQYGLYNNSYSWLISLMFDPIDQGGLSGVANSYTTYVNLTDFMDAGKDYLIFCYDRPNSTQVGAWDHIWDINPLSDTNETLIMDESGDHFFQKNERFRMTFEREVMHWFIIVEVMSANVSLIQAKATNDTVLVTNQGYVGSTYVINATAHTGTDTEFVVFCNRTITSVTINGSPVSYSHNLTSMILTFNHTFASDADIEINGGVDSTDPSITSPSDVSYTEGDIGNSISWIVTESYPDEYNITRNGALIQSGSYSSGVPITISVDGLSVGTYTYVIGANDTTGNSASDSVTVTVTAAPPSDGAPSDGDEGDGTGESKSPAFELITINSISIDPNELVEVDTTSLNLHAFITRYAGGTDILSGMRVKLTFHDTVSYLTESSDYYETTVDLSLMTLQLHTSYKLTLEATKPGYATITFVCYIVLLPPPPEGYNMTYFLIGVICFTLSVISVSVYVHDKRR